MLTIKLLGQVLDVQINSMSLRLHTKIFLTHNFLLLG